MGKRGGVGAEIPVPALHGTQPSRPRHHRAVPGRHHSLRPALPEKQRSLRDYFLADRNIPWWAIALSIVAAETSTLTIISMPGLAYDSNLTFLQVAMGYVVGRIIISVVLLPHYFRGDLYTAYQLIERRFGTRLRTLT